MRNTNLLLASCCIGLLIIGGCARDRSIAHDGKLLNELPFVYRMTIQQGNILSEEMARSVQIGMTREQVRYLLGTPLLTDFFHANRWDYVYTIKRGHGDTKRHSMVIQFQDDLVSRIDTQDWGAPQEAPDSAGQQVLVTVPDYQKRRSFFKRILRPNKAKPATVANKRIMEKAAEATANDTLPPARQLNK